MDLIKNLTKQVTEMNAGVGHVMVENIEHKEGFTAVISVYEDRCLQINFINQKLATKQYDEDNSPKQKTEFQNIVYIRKAETK